MSVNIKYANDLKTVIECGKIAILGAGKIGKSLVDYIEKTWGDVSRVAAIMDNDEKKQGTTYKGIAIISVEDAVEVLDKCVLLVAIKSYKAMLTKINQMHKFDGWDCYIYPLIQEGWVWEADEELRYIERINRYALIQYSKNLYMKNVENREELVKTKRRELQSGDSYIIPKMVFIVTNRCTLKCAGCLGRVPYFKDPQHMAVEDVLRDMEMFLECIDECITIEIAGGEPLLYPHLDILLDYLIQQKKVLGIGLTTNGTVIPDEKVLNYLANDKVWVGISDYGMLDRLAKTVYAFEKNNIHFEIYSDMRWIDPGNLEKRNKTQEVLGYEYNDCWDAYNCKVIVGGRLFVCPRYARLYMQQVHNFEKDSVCLKEITDIERRREAIYALYMMDYAESCDYCDFGAAERKMIKPGEQITNQFYQSQYTLVKRNNF